MADIQGLLGNPFFNIGTGLLAQSGYSPVPVTMGQAIGGAMQYANERQIQSAQLDQARSQIEAQKQRQQAANQLSGLLMPNAPADGMGPVMPAPITTQTGQAQALGLLGQVAPEQLASQLLSQQFAKPETPRLSTEVNDFMLMNPNLKPGTPEFSSEYRKFAAEEDPTGGLSEQIALQLQMMQLEDLRRARDKEEKTEAQAFRGLSREVAKDLSKLEEMATLNDRLQDTFLGAGKPMPDLRRGISGATTFIQDLFGQDTTQSRQVEADFDRLSKLTTDFVVGSLDRFADTGSVSIPKFNALLQSNASMSASPIANNLIISDNISTILDAAEVEGIDISNADSLRSLASQLKATSAANAKPDVRTAPMEDLMQMDDSMFTPEELQIILQRAGQ